MYIDVLVEVLAGKDQTFTYKIDPSLNIKPGMRVLVPFGRQTLEGFVLGENSNENFNYNIKEIIKVVDEKPVINEEMMMLGKYISKKTLAPLITCYQTMLPSALKAKKKNDVKKKYDTYLVVTNKIPILKSEKQKEMYNLILNGPILKKECTNISSYAVKVLLEKEYIREEKKEVYRINENSNISKTNLVPNENQQSVLNEIELNKFMPYLLHGVTGSGKTLVYIKLIEEILKTGKEAILLVPEISLTPQVVNIFKKEFGDTVAILHSALSAGEKYDEWRKIERKEVSIAIGARSAVFAPFTNLGIIIIDEEHSETYKQECTPKYNAIDIALKRAKTYDIPVVLGSATPSIESYTRALAGVYKLLEMKTRVNENMPEITLVNMKDEFKKGNRVFSEILKQKINEKLEKNEQIIILLNRRGFSTTITCKECGFTHKCPNCDIPLVYHKGLNQMKCHYCNYSVPKLKKCPSCHNDSLTSFGMGTEKLEHQIQEEFPSAKTIRMDFDTTRNKGTHAKIIEDFKNENYNVLVGTQMIAKGLDFPKVTLVGVISGDSSLNIPDFRSAERTFQLLSQISGRAGRDKLKGEVIIQGFNIDHYSIVLSKNNDYSNFYKEEMNIRKKLKYPPFYNLCLIKLQGKDFNFLYSEGEKIATYLRNNTDNIVLGPSNGMMPKINNIYYLNIIIKYKNTKEIYEKLVFIKEKYLETKKMKIEVDLNPFQI